MIDLSNNNTPFKDLTEEAQMEVVRAMLSGSLKFLLSGKVYAAGSITPNTIYRIPAQPPVYPWEHIADYIEWIAIDEDGEIRGYEERVEPGFTCWMTDGEFYRLHIKIERGTVPWTETLQRRPKSDKE